MEQLMTVADVQEKCQVSRSTVIRWINSGKLKASKPADWRIRPSDLNEMLEKSSYRSGS